MVCPLADDFVSWAARVAELILKDVVAARSVTVLVEKHTGAGTACKPHKGNISLSFIFNVLYTDKQLSVISIETTVPGEKLCLVNNDDDDDNDEMEF